MVIDNHSNFCRFCVLACSLSHFVSPSNSGLSYGTNIYAFILFSIWKNLKLTRLHITFNV